LSSTRKTPKNRQLAVSCILGRGHPVQVPKLPAGRVNRRSNRRREPGFGVTDGRRSNCQGLIQSFPSSGQLILTVCSQLTDPTLHFVRNLASNLPEHQWIAAGHLVDVDE
jgi:hypothetical protein